MRSELLYFLAIARALSILSTTRTLPTRFFNNSLNLLSVVINSLAGPIAPFSFNAPAFGKSPLDLTVVKGKNVALPNLLSLRYFIRFLATFSSSVIIFCIAPPKAISIAVSYLDSTLITSATTPTIPLSLTFRSITFLILLPYPS